MTSSSQPSRRFLAVFAVYGVLALGLCILAASGLVSTAHAEASSFPGSGYGNIALPSGLAIKIPANGQISPRGAIALYNGGTGTVYCGFDVSVTTNTGFPIAAGAALTINLGFDGARGQVWCITGSAQTSPADVRYLEIR